MAVSLGQKSGRTKNEVNAERIPQYSVLSLATGEGGIRVNLCPTPQGFSRIFYLNLVPRGHVPFGQHRETEP